MIGRLVGRVVHEEPTGSLVLDVQGVGYELICPIGTVGRAQTLEGDPTAIIIIVHTNLRQDSLELFGFSAPAERAAFRLLTTVPNVGPRLALSVLNVLPASELSLTIEAEDKAKLSKVPGVGKKTAERLVLELRGKLPHFSHKQGGALASPSSSSPSSLSERLIAALTGLGYRPAEAERAAKALTTSQREGTELSQLLREALQFLAS